MRARYLTMTNSGARSGDEWVADARDQTVHDLLRGYGAILDELQRRQICSSANSPISDYAEGLFCSAFGWKRQKNSKAGFDAIDEDGVRYQVKARRVTPSNRSRQLSAIRRLDQNPFDVLAGVLFDEDFLVYRAALIPIALVQGSASRVEYTNSNKFHLRDAVWSWEGVEDVTDQIRAAAAAL